MNMSPRTRSNVKLFEKSVLLSAPFGSLLRQTGVPVSGFVPEKPQACSASVFGVESTQYQELLIGEFVQEFKRQGILDVEPVCIPSKENKCVRIRRLGTLLASRKLRFKANCPSTKMLVDQCRDFP